MLLLPKKIGPFTLVRKLGTGGVSESYAGALDASPSRKIVARRILPYVLRDPNRRVSVEMRVKDLLGVRHPYLVQVLEWQEDGDDRYLVEEWVEGVDLERLIHWLRQHGLSLPPNIFLHLATQICNALEALHGRPGKGTGSPHVLHLGLMPGHLYVTREGKVVVGGYALTRSPTSLPQGGMSGPVPSRMEYLSPEQTHPDQKLTPASDVFALGTIFYELLTLSPLFRAESSLRTIHRIRRAEVTEPMHKVRQRMPGLDKVLLRALSLNPRHRYQRSFVLREDLRGLMAGFSFANIGADVQEFLRPVFEGSLALPPQHHASGPAGVGSYAGAALAGAADMVTSQRQDRSTEAPTAPARSPDPVWVDDDVDGGPDLPTDHEIAMPSASADEDAEVIEAASGPASTAAWLINPDDPGSFPSPASDAISRAAVSLNPAISAGQGADSGGLKVTSSQTAGPTMVPEIWGADEGLDSGEVTMAEELLSPPEAAPLPPAPRPPAPRPPAPPPRPQAAAPAPPPPAPRPPTPPPLMGAPPSLSPVRAMPSLGPSKTAAHLIAPSEAPPPPRPDPAPAPRPRAPAPPPPLAPAPPPQVSSPAQAPPPMAPPELSPPPDDVQGPPTVMDDDVDWPPANRSKMPLLLGVAFVVVVLMISCAGVSYYAYNQVRTAAMGIDGTLAELQPEDLEVPAELQEQPGDDDPGTDAIAELEADPGPNAAEPKEAEPEVEAAYAPPSRGNSSQAEPTRSEPTRSEPTRSEPSRSTTSNGSYSSGGSSSPSSASSFAGSERTPTASTVSSEDLIANLEFEDSGQEEGSASGTNVEAYAGSARSGSLSGTDVTTLEMVSADDPSYTRSRALLLMDAERKGDSRAVRKYIDDLMALPENRYNPVFLARDAQYWVNKGFYSRSMDIASRAERYWARIPPELVFDTKSEIYQVQAASQQGLFYASEDDLDALDQAVRAWEKYRQHVSTKGQAAAAARADREIAKLEDVRRRLE